MDPVTYSMVCAYRVLGNKSVRKKYRALKAVLEAKFRRHSRLIKAIEEYEKTWPTVEGPVVIGLIGRRNSNLAGRVTTLYPRQSVTRDKRRRSAIPNSRLSSARIKGVRAL